MLSSVLRSRRAIQMNINIMRTFARLRELLAANRDLAARVEKLERSHDRTASVIEILVDSFTPYLQLAGGGQLMHQVVTNSKVAGKPSVTVPAYTILRGDAGALIEVDLYRFTLTFDHALMGLAQREREPHF